jgi:hypothetical protein
MATRDYEADERHRVKAARNRQAKGNTKFICECADLRCNATLDLTAAEYAGMHASSIRFWVKPGHGIPALERVLEENDRYEVVEKLRTAAYVLNMRGSPAR